MNLRIPMVLAFVLLVPIGAPAKKKSPPDRAMLEKMEAVPCGAKQKGLSGLGSFWASVGITDVHSNEKLCPQYLLRTDDMDYKIRPMDMKHPLVLPVGHEVIFKISKDRMFVRVPDGDDKHIKKMQPYEVVAAEPNAIPNENASAGPTPR
ncbi:MAG TPA: hypothetical protein VMU53_03365 [Candidatus Sulfotelmatobacter sp.]|nr:hypothetical protein [Candidatus Sulfotelmatobacter sp.]